GLPLVALTYWLRSPEYPPIPRRRRGARSIAERTWRRKVQFASTLPRALRCAGKRKARIALAKFGRRSIKKQKGTFPRGNVPFFLARSRTVDGPKLLGRLETLRGVGEHEVDLLVARSLGYFALAVGAAEADRDAGDVNRLAIGTRLASQRAGGLLQLTALHELQVGLASILGGVFRECLGAVLAAELNLAAVEIRRLVGLSRLTRDRALQCRGIGRHERGDSQQSNDRQRGYAKTSFHNQWSFQKVS